MCLCVDEKYFHVNGIFRSEITFWLFELERSLLNDRLDAHNMHRHTLTHSRKHTYIEVTFLSMNYYVL